MKIIKIGSSQSCDIVLDSNFVSSLHAEMTILDDGQIILEDKNSKNGTQVGNKRIEPGKYGRKFLLQRNWQPISLCIISVLISVMILF